MEDTEHYNPIDYIRSSHFELINSHEFSHEDENGYIYTDIALRSIYDYWTTEQQNPIRSERSKTVGKMIANKALFELSYRTDKLLALEELYGTMAA